MSIHRDLRYVWGAMSGGIDPVSEILGALKESTGQLHRRFDKAEVKLDDIAGIAADAKTSGDKAMAWISTRGENTAQIVERLKWMIAGVSSASVTVGAALVYYGGKLLQVLHTIVP